MKYLSHKLNSPCPYCNRKLTGRVLAKKRKNRIEKIRASLKTSPFKVGRSISPHVDDIIKLNSEGLSVRVISNTLGVHRSTVYSTLRRVARLSYLNQQGETNASNRQA
jgi:DNA invertase Pin-like site-specific DNA recombinase